MSPHGLTRLCRPNRSRVESRTGRPMLRMAFGRRLISRLNIPQEQNVIVFQFYIRMPNFRHLGLIIKKKIQKVAYPFNRYTDKRK